jgi:hypothetical protein
LWVQLGRHHGRHWHGEHDRPGAAHDGPPGERDGWYDGLGLHGCWREACRDGRYGGRCVGGSWRRSGSSWQCASSGHPAWHGWRVGE